MTSAVKEFEVTRAEALVAIENGQWHRAMKSLESMESACTSFDFIEAMPSVLLAQMVVYEALGKESLLLRTWQDLQRLFQGGQASSSFLRDAQPFLEHFSQRLGLLGDLEGLLDRNVLHRGRMEMASLTQWPKEFCSDQFAELHPAALGLALGLVGAFAEPSSVLRKWLEPYLSMFGSDETSSDFLELMGLLVSEPREIVRVYRKLCAILEEPESSSPVIVCLAWLSAMLLENEGLPSKLAFSPNPPQEQRMRASLNLLARLSSFDSRLGLEGVLESLWRATLDTADELLEQIRLRHERGGKKSADVEVNALCAYQRSQALIYFGYPEAAEAELRPMLDIAGRQALNSHWLAVAILVLGGQIAESKFERTNAATYYLKALSIVMPRFDPETPAPALLAVMAALETEPKLTEHLLRSVAGWLRVTEARESAITEFAYDIMEVTASTCDPKVHAQGCAHVCLALAYRGQTSAARQAEMWSARSGMNALKAVAWVYRILLDPDILNLEEHDFLDELSLVVDSLPATSFRFSVQLLLAEGVIRSGVRKLRPTGEMMIRRAASTLSNQSYREVGDANLLLLPSSWQSSLSDTIEAAIEVELSASLRPLLQVFKKPVKSEVFPQEFEGACARLSGQIGHLVNDFLNSGTVSQELVEQVADALDPKNPFESNRLPRLERPRGREAFLESYVIGERWVAMFVSNHGGGVVCSEVVEELESSAEFLAEQLNEYIKAGDRIYVDEDLPLGCVGFERLLKLRNEVEIIYGSRQEDDIEPWNSPPQILMIGDGWTSEHLNLIHSGLKNELHLRMIHGFDEVNELAQGEWSTVDVVLFGAQRASAEGVVVWEDGQALEPNLIGFARGDCAKGLGVVLCEDRKLGHQLGRELTPYFPSGVLVVVDTRLGYEVICDLLNRASLLTHHTEVSRYVRRCLEETKASEQDFCVLYVED